MRGWVASAALTIGGGLIQTGCRAQCEGGACAQRAPTAVAAIATKHNASAPPVALSPIEIPRPLPPYVMFGVNARHAGRRPVAPALSPVPSKAMAPELLWQTPIGAPVTGGVVMGPDHRIYVAAHDGVLYGLRRDGQIELRAATGERSWSTPAIASDGTVYVGSDDDHVYAFSPAGELKWKLRLGDCDPKGFGPAGTRCDADGGPTIGHDGTIYVGGDGVHAIAPDGTLRWKFTTPQHVASPPAIGEDGTIYVGCQDDTLYALTADGALTWSVKTKGDIDGGAAIGDDGTIYAGSDDGALYAISPEGDVLWKTLTGDDIRGTPALGGDGTIYVGSYDGYLYAVAPSGAVRWRFATAGKIHGSPLVAGDMVLIGSQDNALYAVHQSGRLAFSLPFAGDVDSTPWVADDGTLYVVGDDGIVSAFGKRAP